MIIARLALWNSGLRNYVAVRHSRGFFISRAVEMKEIVEKKEGKNLEIEGVFRSSIRDPYLLKANGNTEACPVCRAGVEIKHTDVLILSQFLRHDGCMLPRRVTGLCKKQQKRLSKMVAMAQKAGLMPNIAPANSKCDPRKRKEWKQFNSYFDENTIKA